MDPLTAEQVAAFQAGDQENQVYQIGQRIKDNEDNLVTLLADKVVNDTYGMITVKLSVTADGTSGINFTMPAFDFEIIDVVVHCTATNASGTATLRRLTTAITDAITCDTENALARAGTIDQAEKAVTAGETLNVITAGAADRGEVEIIGRRA